MTTIKATVITDSVNTTGQRITTFQLRYPLFIHAELMTHRVFSRNAQSNRAIPIAKIIEDIKEDPVIPLFWGKNQPGMQAFEEVNAIYVNKSVNTWMLARDAAIDYALKLEEYGLHKQIVNRVLSPFQHINVIVTSTEYENFFSLRDHPDAEPHMQILAKRMKQSLHESTPKELEFNEWHLPYITLDELQSPVDNLTLAKLSAARCARVSYLTHDQKPPSKDNDLELADKLSSSRHLSPFEHPAQSKCLGDKYANFHGWKSLRCSLETKLPWKK